MLVQWDLVLRFLQQNSNQRMNCESPVRFVPGFFCGIITTMSKKVNNRKRKQKKIKNGSHTRLILICVEIFALVIIVGMGVLIWWNSEKTMGEKEEQPVAVVEEIQIDRESRLEKKEEEVPEDTSRYGTELADAEYCMQNRIYAKETASENEIVLAFAGDVSFAEGYANMNTFAQRGGNIRDCFDEFAWMEIQSADIFMLNNEFTYSTRGTPTPKKQFTFRAKPEMVNCLNEMGVDIVSLANNHVYDYGEVSLLDTLSTLEEASVPYVGAGRNLEEAIKPVYFVANDMKIAYVSATQIEQGDYPDTPGAGENSPGVFRCWTEERIYDVVHEAQEEADFVIVYIHWGAELSESLHWAQAEQAPKLVEAGADLIVGDHPHCLQEIAYIGDVPVIYSMGNFWFNSKTQDTGILKAVINEEGLQSLQFVPAIQSGCKTTIAADGERERILKYIQSLSPTIAIDGTGNITKR